MLTLIEQAKRIQNPLRRGIIELYARNTPVLQYLPFMNISGNAFLKLREQYPSSVAFRGINTNYTEGTATMEQITAALKMAGGEINIDRYHIVTSRGAGENPVSTEVSAKTKSLALRFTKAFFKGDSSVDTNSFDGLEVLIDSLASSQKIAASTSAGGGDLTLDLLDALIDAIAGEPTILFMNKPMRRKVNSLMRSAGQAIEPVSGNFGQLFYKYAGIPIGVIEVDDSWNDILAFDEHDYSGSTADCTSIYAARMGTDGLIGIQSSPPIVDDQGMVRNQRVIVVDWFVNQIIQHPKSVARLYALKLAGYTATTSTTT
jgi:hypothetical protein